jgi:hypothetical protein
MEKNMWKWVDDDSNAVTSRTNRSEAELGRKGFLWSAAELFFECLERAGDESAKDPYRPVELLDSRDPITREWETLGLGVRKF